MIVPKFLKKNSTIGIVAPSDCFPSGKYKTAALRGAKKLESLGYSIKYAPSCFNSINGRSNDAKTRAKEFVDMYFDDSIDALIAISGGEYEMEILDYLPLRKMKKHPKLFCGYSDNTVLSFVLLTNLEMINIYGHNLYELAHEHEVINNYLKAIQGKFLPLEEIKDVADKDYDYENKIIKSKYRINYRCDWKVYNSKDIDVKGIMIGGLIDNLYYIHKTKYDKVRRFIRKYRDDGFIWCFDICLFSPDKVRQALKKFKESGWFKNAKAIMFGRTIIKNKKYEQYILKELKELNVPIVLDVNVSHIPPSYHIVNGKRVRLKYTSGKGKINYLEER